MAARLGSARREPAAAWAEQESDVVQGALDGLDAVVSWLAGVPGRKAILYVSDGLPLVPGDDLLPWAADRSNSRGAARGSRGSPARSNDMSKRFREVTSHASRNRVAIYPIEAYGARANRGRQIRAGRSSPTARTGSASWPRTPAAGRCSTPRTRSAALSSWGGPDDLLLARLHAGPAGRTRPEHKIEVKVKAKGAQVRHRQWYRDKPAGETVAERTLAVMRFGPEDNPLGAALEIGAPKAKEDGGVLVPVRVKVPIAKLYLQPRRTASAPASLRLYVVASGEAGATTPVRETGW